MINFPSVFKELSEPEAKSNFKFSILVSLLDKSMFVLVLIVSKSLLTFSRILCTLEKKMNLIFNFIFRALFT